MVVSAASCTRRRVEATFDRAEAMIHDNPSEALSLLRDSIDATCLARGSELQARHALLLSQALDKNRIDQTNDSLIAIATDYYSTHRGDDLRLMLADYYRGRVIYNSGNYPEAIMHYLKALEIAEADSDHYWIGLISREISESYLMIANISGRLFYAEKSYQHTRLTGKHSYTGSAMCHLINALYDRGRHSDGLKYSYQLLDSATIYDNKRLLTNAYRLIGKGYLLLKDENEAAPFLEKAYSLPSATMLDSIYLGVAYCAIGRKDDAYKIISSIDSIQTLESSWLRFSYYRTFDYKRALRELEMLYDSLDHKFKVISASNVPQNVTNLHIAERDQANNRLNDYIFTTKIITGVLILLLVPIGVKILLSYRKQKKEIEKNLIIANELREILSVNSNNDAKARQIVEETLASKHELIDHLCKELYQKQHSSTMKRRISNEISIILNCFAPDGSITAKLEAEANKYYDNIIHDFHNDFPNLKSQDYTLFLLSVWGFSVASISMIQNEEKTESTYNRRARLKTRIKRSNSPNSNRYLQHL